MRHINIKRVTGIIFVDDSNFLDIKYEDNKGKNIDKFVLKNIVDGLSRSKSFVVGHTKYHIHNDRSEVDKMSESLNRYNKTLKNSIENMKDDFVFKGKPVDVVKRYLGRSILSDPIPGGEAIVNNDKKTYGHKAQLMTYDESTKNENIYTKDIIEYMMPPAFGAISRDELPNIMSNLNNESRSQDVIESEKYLMTARKTIKKNIDYKDLDVDTVFWKYLESRGMKIRKGDDK